MKRVWIVLFSFYQVANHIIDRNLLFMFEPFFHSSPLKAVPMNADAHPEDLISLTTERASMDNEESASLSSRSTGLPSQQHLPKVTIDDGKLSLSSNLPSRPISIRSQTNNSAATAPPINTSIGSNAVQTSAKGLALSSFEPTVQNNSSTPSLTYNGLSFPGAGAPLTSHSPSLVNVHNSSRPSSMYNGKTFLNQGRNGDQPLSTSILSRYPTTKPSFSQYRYDDDNVSQMSTSSLATSFSKNFLFGFLNNKQKDKINSSTGLLSKEYWMKDETSAECFICGRHFTTFRRKHHCRICGQIFCSACTTLISGEKFNYNGKMRACKTCISIAKDYNDSSDDDTSYMEESFADMAHIHDNDTHTIHEEGSIGSTTPIEDHAKLTGSTSTPTSRMAIPATRNGEAGKIPISRSFNPKLSSLHTANFRSKPRNYKFSDLGNSNSKPVRLSSSYNNTSNTGAGNESSFAEYINTHSTNTSAFNFNNEAHQDDKGPEDQSVHQSSDSEDEASMSIYAALHLDKPIDPRLKNKILAKPKVSRNNTRSLDRAQASLLRMRNRKKSKSLSRPQVQINVRVNDLNNSLANYSSSNLESPLNFDDSYTSHIFSTPLSDNQEELSQNVTSSIIKYSSELNEVCFEHFKNLLHQSLSDEEVTESIDEWEQILTPLLQEVEKVEYNVKAGESMDIRQYIKVKRLTGATKQETRMIDGIVFSKTFALKTMPKHISNPKIALIMFPLEYMRTGQHYMSLEPVLAQENEYIHKLVARIVALNADVVFVGASVSGLALKLLDDAGIAVAYNMKPQVIERIARLTQADIVISMDKLAVNLKLGQCKSLDVKTFCYGRITKTMIFLTGCDQRLGSTILIRGGDDALLRKIKEAVDFMVYVVCNLKLETAFYRDNFMYLSLDFYRKLINQPFDQNDNEFASEFLKSFHKKILSASPTVQFELPQFLTKIRELEKTLQIMRDEYEKLDGEIDVQQLEISDNVIKELKLETTTYPITNNEYLTILKCLYQRKIQLQEDSISIRKRQWNLFQLSAPNLLDPQSHQKIAFLYSMVSMKSATPCIGPHPLQIDFYWDSDMTLGQYVEHLIMSAHNSCSEGCGETISNHYRSYVHASAKIDVTVEKFQSRTPTLQNVVLSWSYCKNCGYTTPYLPMSDTTYKYSFGKFLELCFRSAKNSSTNLGHCIHDFSKDHIKYFSRNDLTVKMEYSKVDILDLIVPRMQLAWKPHTNIRLKIENHQQVIQKSKRFFNSILSRLNRVKVDSISNDKMEAGQKRIKQLIDKVNEQQSEVKEMIDELYLATDASDQLQMNSVLRFVQDLSVEWDSEFAIFENDYLPSEKDIARITTHQLKRFFLDDNEVKQVNSDVDNKNTSEFAKREVIDGEKREFKEKVAGPKQQPQASPLPDFANLDKKADDTKPKEPKEKFIEPKQQVQTPALEDFADVEKDKDNTKPDLKASNEIPNKPRTSISTPLRKVSVNSETSENNYSPMTNKVLEEVSKFEKLMGTKEENTPTRTESHDNSHLDSTKVPGHSKAASVGKTDSYFPEYDAYSKLGSKKPQFDISAKFLEQKLKEGRQKSFSSSTSPATNPKSNSNKEDSKVMKLTSYFDQIHFETLSKEFEMQRERERRKLIQNRYKAAPVSSSKPIVEVYKNVKDAVNEDDIGGVESDGETISEGMDEKPKTNTKPIEIGTKETDNIPQTERVSLMKTLANFWADRSATLWKPLEYPLGPSEHIFVDSDVIVREDEPSSLVSFCLSSSDYVKKIGAIREEQNLESIMLKKTAVHLKYQFKEGNTILSCKIFFAEQFDAFRRKCDIDDKFIQSLARCVKWDSAGGKSGSAFLKTLDDRLVIKELSSAELESFVRFAPSYFEYMAQALFHDLPTVIAKVFGFYQIHIKNPIDGKNLKMDVLVMENLFYDKKNLRIFDLKGSMRNRHVEKTGKENEVLLDENMVEYIYESPLFVREYDKKLLKASLWNDTLFLAKVNVMDYSLVIGIDDENKLLTVGIIDCIRTFTWDKKLESWVKEKGFVGGGTKEPTVVTPRQYKNRFREAMDRYILMVPDEWFQGNGPYGLSHI